MVSLNIKEQSIRQTVQSLISLFGISETDDGGILICDSQNADSAVHHAPSAGIIVLYSHISYLRSSIHNTLLREFGSKYVTLEYPFFYDELGSIIRKFITADDSTVPPHQTVTLQEGSVVSYGDKSVKLSAREFALFKYLYDRCGQAVSRHELREKVWTNETLDGTNVVDVYISYLRKKLTPLLGEGVIVSRRAEGYVYNHPRK